MITFVTSGLTVLWMVVFLSGPTESEPSFRASWFSPYGPAGYGRVLSEGADLGQLTLIQCSRFCSDKGAACMALQFHRTTGKTGTCYIFPSLTYNTAMIASPGHRYLEKRICVELRHFTATVMYPTDNVLVLFSGEITFVFALEVSVERNTTITRLRATQIGSHALIFPGLTGEVDGAFVGPSGHTYIVQGSRLRCYTPVNVTKTLFEECSSAVDTDILGNYFASEIRLDDIVSMDDNADSVVVMKDNTVYRLQWERSTYIVLDSFIMADSDIVDNIWRGLPRGLTAISKFVNAQYLIVEDVKLMLFNPSSQKASSIFTIC